MILKNSVLLPPRYVRNYVSRLRRWIDIRRDVVATGSESVRAMRRSFRAAPLNSLRGLAEWRDPVLLEPATVNVANLGRFNLRPGTDDLWHVAPGREPFLTDQMRRLLKDGDTFVDAGANIGTVTVAGAKLVGPQGLVIAVEMMPETAAILRDHIELNGLTNVTVVENALAADNGEVVHASVSGGRWGQATIAAGSHNAQKLCFAVRTTTLDEVLKSVEKVKLLKIDIEGAELEALAGAKGSLNRIQNIIYEELPGAKSVQALLTDAGFKVSHLVGDNFMAARF